MDIHYSRVTDVDTMFYSGTGSGIGYKSRTDSLSVAIPMCNSSLLALSGKVFTH
jgi:hypothetical protein